MTSVFTIDFSEIFDHRFTPGDHTWGSGVEVAVIAKRELLAGMSSDECKERLVGRARWLLAQQEFYRSV